MSGKAWFECCVSLHFSLKGRMSVAIHDRRTPARYTWGVRSAAAPSASTGRRPVSLFRPDFRRPRMDTYEKRNLLEKSYHPPSMRRGNSSRQQAHREKDIPPHILRSWKLSREAGMDPLNPQVPPVLNKPGTGEPVPPAPDAHRLGQAHPRHAGSLDPRHRVHRHPRGGLGPPAGRRGRRQPACAGAEPIQHPRRAEEHQDHWGVGRCP